MAIAHVQDNNGYLDGGTSLNVSYSTDVTAGSLLLAACSSYNGGGPGGSHTISDDNGNTWNEIADTNYDGNDVCMYAYALNANSGATTVTFTNSSGSSYTTGVIVEVSGIETTGALDQNNENDSSGSTWDSGNITTTSNDEYLFGTLALDNGNRTLTEDGAFTLIFEQQNGNTDMPISTAYRIVSSTLTESYSGTIAVSSQYCSGIASFIGVAAAGGRTTLNTDQHGLGIASGVSFMVKAGIG